MARKYSPESLVAPIGRFPLAMFPGKLEADRTALLEVWLDDGYAKAAGMTNEDEAALAWAYHRGFEARALELASMESTVNVPGEVTTTRTDAQRATFERQAAEWLSTFYGYTSTGETNDSLIPPSGTSKTHFGWAGTLQG